MQLTPFQALSELLALGVTFKNDRRQVLYEDGQRSSSRRSKPPKVRTENVTLEDARAFRELAIYFADLSMLVYRTQDFAPTVVASACVLAARKKFKMQPLWSEALRDMTQHCYEELVDCMNLLLLNFQTIDLGKRTASTEEVLGLAPFSEGAIRSSQQSYENGPQQIVAQQHPPAALCSRSIIAEAGGDSPRKRTSPSPIAEAISPLFMFDSVKGRKSNLHQYSTIETMGSARGQLFLSRDSGLSSNEGSLLRGMKSTSVSSRVS